MAEPLIEIEQVAKWYRTRLRRDWLLMRPFARRRVGDEQTGVWALSDVSVQLDRGRSLAIIGNNGAGKSTLMRVIAGISRPTRGRVRVNGRVAVRFGYGLAFNPYLTGRENVFLEGTVLGLTNREVRSSLDQIIDFAGLDGAIDRPLWTYSSGMVSRLGFAIATRIDSDVLLLDEALSAGDGTFRQRSEQVLGDARDAGRSLVVVTHGLGLARRLCDEGLWLEKGVARALGPVDDVVDAYEEAAGLPSTRKKEDEAGLIEGDAG